MICRTTAKEKKPSYGGKQYSLQGASGTASGAAEYTNAYRSSDSILVVHCSSFRERPPGAALSSHRKGYLRWSSYRHVCCLTAGILLLISGGICAILQGWLYTDLLWAGAFGCLMAALNFRDSKNDGG